jgi:hypothetical protein
VPLLEDRQTYMIKLIGIGSLFLMHLKKMQKTSSILAPVVIIVIVIVKVIVIVVVVVVVVINYLKTKHYIHLQ